MKKAILILTAPLALGVAFAAWHLQSPKKVGQQSSGGIVVVTGQSIKPVGKIVTMPSRPVDLAISNEGNFVYLKDSVGVSVVDCKQMKLIKQIKLPGGDSFFGIVLSEDGKTLLTTTCTNLLVVFDVDGGTLTERKRITFSPARVGGSPTP